MDPTLIKQFQELTNATEQEATFFLETSNGELEQAISNFFSDSGSTTTTTNQQQTSSSPLPSPSVQRHAPSVTTTAAPPSSSSSSTTAKKPQERRSGMVTFKDLNSQEGGDTDENANRYYAGGSRTSGQQILGRDDVDNANDLTSQIFKKAQERGAQHAHEFNQQRRQEKFIGSGNRLGATPSDDNAQQQQGGEASSGDGEEEKTVTITFYQDGFTIDDGELRRFDDPANQQFLKSINEGYVPREVAGMAKEVLVNLVDKKTEKYAPSQQTFQAFKGEGRSLGGTRSVPTSSSSMEPVQTPAYSADKNRPHTNIQIRLHDGTRLNATFNLDDTIKTLMQFVQAARPGVGSFQLMTTFPRKVLSDPHQTIEQAGLKNAAIVQNLV